MHIARIKIRDEATTVKQAKDITNKTLARIKRGIAEYQRSLPDEMAKLREEEKRRAPEKAARQLAILAREQREANAEEFRQQMKEEFPHFIEGDDYIIVAGSIVYGESAPPTPRQRAFKAAFEAFEELRQKDGADMKPAEPQTNGTAKANGKAHDFDPPEWDRPPAQACVDPVDSFVAAITPELPRGALPELIEKVSFAESARMGVDPGVMAMSMLTMCAASIPDQLRLKVKRAVTDRWYQSARLWTMTIGTASTKKSPAQDAAVEPYRGIDIKVRTDSDAAEAAYIDAKKAKDKKDGGDSEIEKPVPKCAIISDISPERAATMMVNNPRGLAVIHDELVSFFGGLDRYGNRGGGAGKAATGMWLSAFNGIGYPIDREGRKTPTGKHMGVSILGSFQPGVIGSLADEGAKHDGLIQRFCYVFAKHVGEGFDRDIDPAHTLEHYDRLIENLYYHMPLGHGHDFHFHEKAHQAKELAFKWINAQLACAEDDNPQLAWHLGKWENIFVRLCLLFHVVEHWSDKVGKPVSG